jgi:hypothetical protein
VAREIPFSSSNSSVDFLPREEGGEAEEEDFRDPTLVDFFDVKGRVGEEVGDREEGDDPSVTSKGEMSMILQGLPALASSEVTAVIIGIG